MRTIAGLPGSAWPPVIVAVALGSAAVALLGLPVDTIASLVTLHPDVHFVWLMGADNLAQFHRWKDWQEIMHSVPVGVLARPGDRVEARTAKAAQVFRHARLAPRASKLLGRLDAPHWCFVNVPMVDASSTRIRARGDWR